MDLLATAKDIADRVEAESVTQDVPVAVTVIDIHGNVVLTHRMIGAPMFSLELAERKAYTSALVGLRTADLGPLAQPGAELYPLLAVAGGRYSAMGGGVPLTSEGQVIAGVGVSGGTTEQDIALVEAAMSQIAVSKDSGPPRFPASVKPTILPEPIAADVIDVERAERRASEVRRGDIAEHRQPLSWLDVPCGLEQKRAADAPHCEEERRQASVG
jgi:uncharacterized protein GlcG (DUF336 family)